MATAVSIENLSVTYRRRWGSESVDALRDLDLSVAAGEVVAVLGPNGSGKTTLLEVLAGGLAPTRGTAAILGHSPDDRALVRRVGYQPEGPLPFASLPGRRFLQHLGAMMRLPSAELADRVESCLTALDLQGFAARPVGTYSTGTARRLAIASALLCDPEVLLLDEPTSGLDPLATSRVLELLAERAQAGVAVLMASHHLSEVEQICDRLYLLESGVCRATGTLEELLGTDRHELVIEGFDDARAAEAAAAIERAGGKIVRQGRERQPLFSVFRNLLRGQGD